MGVNDEKWLIDFDLKVLAKAPEAYAIYAKQIRKEFSIYPDFLYHPGRKKALEHFLEKEYIYQTESFQTDFETKARANIQAEIDHL
jgi:predicted metal-dependent HD superfamily phosphohydrolase